MTDKLEYENASPELRKLISKYEVELLQQWLGTQGPGVQQSYYLLDNPEVVTDGVTTMPTHKENDDVL
jgi:hypothetical protein